MKEAALYQVVALSMKIILVPRASCSLSRRCLNTRTRRSSGSRAQGSSGLAGSGNRRLWGTRIDENSRVKEGGRNLVPRVVSYLSPTRFVDTGRTELWERGWAGRRKRARFCPSFFSCIFVTSHSCVSCPRKTRPLRRDRERSLPSLFCPHSHFFFVFRKILLDH